MIKEIEYLPTDNKDVCLTFYDNTVYRVILRSFAGAATKIGSNVSLDINLPNLENCPDVSGLTVALRDENNRIVKTKRLNQVGHKKAIFENVLYHPDLSVQFFVRQSNGQRVTSQAIGLDNKSA